MVTTAGSLLNAAGILKERGAASVSAAITHGVLCGDAIERIEDSPLDHLYITDTLPLRRPSAKITVVSIAPLVAKAIANVHRGESVSGLF
jgi:ribose-phosphate pyrophosphokinase